MADEHGIAGGPHNHAQHRKPDVGHALRCLLAIADAEHVAHGLEQGMRVLLPPGVILQMREERRWGGVLEGAAELNPLVTPPRARESKAPAKKGF